MYCDFFGLRFRPFEDRADTRLFYATSEGEETLATMEYESHFGKGLALLLGEAGTGKTLLIRLLLQRLESQDQVVVLTWPCSGPSDLVRETSKGFGVSLPSSPNHARFVARLRRHLRRVANSDHRHILIVDQAENLTAQNMAQLASLTELQHNGDKLLRIILVAQPQFRALLDRSDMARIRQQLYGERVLPPLSVTQTEGYIQHRLRIAGSTEPVLFEEEAVRMIHEASSGIPRLINHICNATMLAAYGAGVAQIAASIVAEVASKGSGSRKTVRAQDLGLASTEQVTAGLVSANRRSERAEPGDADSSELPEQAVTDSSSAGPVPVEESNWCHTDASEVVPVGLTDPSPVAQPAPSEAMLSQGKALLNRLELVMAKAERIAAVTDASLTQHTAVEKHLTSLTANAQRLVGSLSGSIEEASECFEDTRSRVDHMIEVAQDRLDKIDSQFMRAAEQSKEVDHQVHRVEQACEQADRTHTGLVAFAEHLANKGDEVQDRMSTLMAGMKACESAQNRLDGLLKQESRLSDDVTEHAEWLRTALSEAKAEARGLKEQFTQQTLDDCHKKLQRLVDDHQQSHAKLVDSAKEQLDIIARQVSSATAEAVQQTETLRTTLTESKSQAQRLHDHIVEKAVADGRSKLQRLVDDHEQSHAKLVDSAKEQLEIIARQVSSATAEAAQQTETLRTTLTESKSQVQGLTRNIVEKAVDDGRRKLQERINQDQKKHSAFVEGAGRKLDGFVERVSSVTADAQQAADRVDGRIAEMKNDAQRFQEQFIKNALDTFRHKLQSALDVHLCTQQQAFETAVGKQEQRLEAVMGDAQTRARALEETLAAGRQTAGEAIQKVQRSVTDMLRSMENDVEEQQNLINSLQQQKEEVRCSTGVLLEDINGAADKVSRLHDTMEHCEQNMDELAIRGVEVCKGLTAAVPGAQRLLRDMQASCGQTESMQRTASALLVDVGGACERLKALSGRSAHYEELAARLAVQGEAGAAIAKRLVNVSESVTRSTQEIEQLLSETAKRHDDLATTSAASKDLLEELSRTTQTGQSLMDQVAESTREAQQAADQAHKQAVALAGLQTSGQSTTQDLGELVGSATQLQRAIQDVVVNADDRIKLLGESQKAADHTLQGLTEAGATSRQLMERVDEAQHNAADVAEQVIEQTHRLADLHAKSGQALPQLEQLIASAGDLLESVQGTIGHADEKIDRLDAQNATAMQALRQLSGAATNGMELVERIGESTREARQTTDNAVAQIDRRMDEVGELSRKIEVTMKELQAQNAGAGELLTRLESASGPAERISTGLAECVARAKTGMEELARQCRQAGEVSGHLSDMQRAVSQAGEVEESLTSETREGRKTCEQMVELVDAAARHGQSLQEQDSAAQDMLEKWQQCKGQAEEAMDRLARQLEATQQSVDAVNPLLSDFTTRTETIERKLFDLEQASGGIDTRIKEMAGKPVEILARAQEQAAQLEKVCSAVRKVFGGLSKASLEARRQSMSSQQTSREASEKLAELTAATDRASKTLQEWVAQAVTVQSRLERTLEHCPTIHDTHPSDSLRRLSRISAPFSPIANSDTMGELSILNDPGASSTPDEQRTEKTVTRAEEISRLIEDAKRTAAASIPS